jgi:hypothetical protein
LFYYIHLYITLIIITITFAIFNIDTLLKIFNAITEYFLVNNIDGLTKISTNYSNINLSGFIFIISPWTWKLSKEKKNKYKKIILYILILIFF